MNSGKLMRRLTARVRRSWTLREWAIRAAAWMAPDRVVVLDMPPTAGRRWNADHPHAGLSQIINANRAIYANNLRAFLALTEELVRIPIERPDESTEPCWNNGWIPASDGVALYGFVATCKPRRYIEVGSGNSTLFARRAIRDGHLETRITSIDPWPRASIDRICDEVIRQPAETVSAGVFDCLEAGDILYIDGSHRVLMNSDVTALFLDVLPLLKPGVLVHVHDITLPHDYPAEWAGRWYSEQYLLAAFLLAKEAKFDILLPNWFIKHDAELSGMLDPLWQRPELQGIALYGGCSFWMRAR